MSEHPIFNDVPPPQPVPANTFVSRHVYVPQRKTGLTLWLLFQLGINFFAFTMIIILLSRLETRAASLSRVPVPTLFHSFILPVIFTVCNLLCLASVWRLKMRGVYGLIALAAVSFVLDLFLSPSFGLKDLIQPFTGAGITYLLAKRQWDDFT